MEDGVPFCSQCGAPQIRVTQASEVVAAEPFPPGTPENVQPPAQPAPLSPVDFQRAFPARILSPNQLDWSHAFPAAAIAGLLAAFCSINALLILVGLPFAGILAVSFYRRRRPDATVSRAMGATLGAVTGAFGFAVFFVLSGIAMVVLNNEGKLRSTLEESIQQAVVRSGNTDPAFRSAIEWIMTPQGLATFIALGEVLMLVAFVILACIGGAVGAALSGGRPRYYGGHRQ